MTTTVQEMKKVKLAILLGDAPEKQNLTDVPVDFEFIYGLGADGLVPFEVALGGKCVGEVVQLTVAADKAPQYFDRLWWPIRQVLSLHPLPQALFFHLTVLAVGDADNREVVQELARSTGGCGGSCGCGCSTC